MYTEKSVSLKNDFYTVYGETRGKLYFEKVGIPCVLLDGDTHRLMFSLDCGVRAYGRNYGDVLKVLDAESNICDVHFVENGKGAQILYSMDVPDIKGMRETALYTVDKLLFEMGSTGRLASDNDTVAFCDRYAPKGWCAVKVYDEVRSAPLPIAEYNVLLIRARKNRFVCNEDGIRQFQAGERERVYAAFAGLKECKTDILFDMMNESQKSIERLLSPSRESLYAVHATYGVGGVVATRICDSGIICFCEKPKTDSAIDCIRKETERVFGHSVRISVVK